MEAIKKPLRSIDRRILKGRLFLLWNGISLDKYKCINKMSKRPVLVGGCGRSGTTLLLSLLSCHPKIFVIPEETAAFCPGAYPPEREIIREKSFRIDFAYKRLIQADLGSCDYEMWCEKTPMNVHFFDRLVDYFGQGLHFLNIVRDGRDVVTSRHPSNPNEYYISPSRWIRDIAAGYKHESHNQFLTLKYENLVDDYIEVMKHVFEFIEVEYNEAIESYPESSSIESSSAWFKGPRPVNHDSVKRWERPEHVEIVNRLMESKKAKKYLRAYGYI